MLRDYERARAELHSANNRNDDLTREADHLRRQNKDFEQRIIEMSRDGEH